MVGKINSNNGEDIDRNEFEKEKNSLNISNDVSINDVDFSVMSETSKIEVDSHHQVGDISIDSQNEKMEYSELKENNLSSHSIEITNINHEEKPFFLNDLRKDEWNDSFISETLDINNSKQDIDISNISDEFEFSDDELENNGKIEKNDNINTIKKKMTLKEFIDIQNISKEFLDDDEIENNIKNVNGESKELSNENFESIPINEQKIQNEKTIEITSSIETDTKNNSIESKTLEHNEISKFEEIEKKENIEKVNLNNNDSDSEEDSVDSSHWKNSIRIDDFYNYNQKSFQRLCQNVCKAMEEPPNSPTFMEALYSLSNLIIIISENAEEFSSNVKENFIHFTFNCVPFSIKNILNNKNIHYDKLSKKEIEKDNITTKEIYLNVFKSEWEIDAKRDFSEVSPMKRQNSTSTFLEDDLAKDGAKPFVLVTIEKFIHNVLRFFINRIEIEIKKNQENISAIWKKNQFETNIKDQQSISFLIQTIELILGKNHFYENNGIYSKNPNLLSEDISLYSNNQSNDDWRYCYDNYTFMLPSKSHKDFSSYLIHNVNIIGKVGAYNRILDLIESDKITTPNMMMSCIKILLKSTPYLNTKISDSFQSIAFNSVKKYFLSLDDKKLRAFKIEEFHNLIALIQNFSKQPGTIEDFQTRDILQLYLYLSLFSSKLIDVRMKGLLNLRKVIKDVTDGVVNNEGNPIRGISTKLLSQWLQEVEILKVMLEGDLNLILMQQSKPLLMFYAKFSNLKKSDIDIMLNSTSGKHISLQQGMYDLILTLQPLMNSTIEKNVLEHFLNTQVRSIQPHMLDFLKIFLTESALKFKKSGRLDIFWSLMQDTKQVDLDVSQKSADIIQILICKPEFEHQRKKLIQFCCENIRLNLSVTQTLTLLQHIIATYPLKSKKKNSVWGVFDQINDKYKLTQILLDSLTPSNGIFSPQKQLNNNSKGKQLTLRELIILYKHPSEEQQLSSRYPLDKKIESKLVFLNYLLKNSSTTLSYSNCKKLWESLYENMEDQKIRNVFVDWLKSTRSTYSTDHILPEKTAIDIFETIIKKVELKKMDLSTFNLFFSFLLSINVEEKKIIPILFKIKSQSNFQDDIQGDTQLKKSNATTIKDRLSNLFLGPKKKTQKSEDKSEVKRFEILTNNLFGINHLWDIALYSSDSNVYKRAICFLNDLNYEFSPQSRPFISIFRQEHLKKCIEIIKKSSLQYKEGIEIETNLKIILRTLEILLDFIQIHCSVSNQDIFEANSELSANFIAINLVFLDLKQNIPLILKENALVSDLYEEAQKIINGKSLRFYIEGSELDSDPKTNIKDIIPQNKTLQVKIKEKNGILSDTLDILGNALGIKQKPKSEPKQTTDIVSLDENQPTIILANQYFREILELFNLNDEIALKAWSLVQLLPSDQQLISELENLPFNQFANEDIKNILSLGNPYILFYRLKIIDTILHGGYFKKSVLWAKKFIEFGGFSHLFKLLRELETRFQHHQTFADKNCFSYLLKLINSLISIVDNFEDEAQSLEESIDSVFKITSKILDPKFRRPRRFSQRIHVRLNNSNISTNYNITTVIRKEPTSIDFEYSEIFESMISESILFSTLCCKQSEIIANSLSKYESLNNAIYCGLLLFKDKESRIKIYKNVMDLKNLLSGKNFVSPLVSYIFQHIEKLGQYESQCDELFLALEDLISTSEPPNQEDEICESIYICYLMKSIFSLPIREASPRDCDKLLVGMLRVLKVLISRYPNQKKILGSSLHGIGTIRELFFHLLFDINYKSKSLNMLLPKCKSNSSRNAAFQLLLEIQQGDVQNSYELHDLIKNYVINPTIMSSIEQIPWGYFPVSAMKQPQGYVGLRNLCATCYLNSLMQQLFMTTPFRNELLSITELDRTKENQEVLFQVQKIFGYLLGSFKPNINTVYFCKAYKDFEGNEIDPNRQQDANEFFNFLFDKIEDALRGTNQSNLLKNYFGGRLVNRTEYEIEGSIRTNYIEEPFFGMNLEVKHQTSILGSLKLLNDGEMLKGDTAYYSEELKSKIDAHRRTFIKHLPPFLTFHLKRFEFNVQTVTSTKLNDRISFPMVIDMFPYTIEGIANNEEWDSKEEYNIKDSSYYQYTLVGVLVHSGGVNSGHYYSYIMDRDTKDHQWFEFNDCQITKFDVNDIPDKCFGGIEEIIMKKENGETVKNKSYRLNNAYMLFYQRTSSLIPSGKLNNEINNSIAPILPKDIPSTSQWDVISQDISKTLNNISNRRNIQIEEILGTSIPNEISDEILKDNQIQFYLRNVFDPNFDQFLLKICENIDADVPFLLYYIFHILAHSKFNEDNFFHWGNILSRLLHKNIKVCEDFFNFVSQPKYLHSLLLACPNSDVRILFSKLIIQAIWIIKVQPNSPPTPTIETQNSSDNSIGINQESNETKIDNSKKDDNLFHNFITQIVSLIPEIKFFRNNSYEYLSILLELSKMDQEEKLIFLNLNVIKELLNSLLQEDLQKINSESAGSKSFELSLSLISTLVRSCETNMSLQKANTGEMPPTFEKNRLQGLILDKESQNQLFNTSNFSRLISQNVNVEAMISILQHWCWESPSVSRNFGKLIVEHLDIPLFDPPAEVTVSQKVSAFISTLHGFLAIDDSMKVTRKQEFLNILLDKLYYKKESIDSISTLACLKYLFQSKDEQVIKIIEERSNELQSICKLNGWIFPQKKKE